MCRGCGRGAFFLGVGDLDKGLEGSGGYVEARSSSWTLASVICRTIRAMEIAHTDDGVQLVSRCREADGDGSARCLFVRGVYSLGSSLPLLVVVGGHCV